MPRAGNALAHRLLDSRPQSAAYGKQSRSETWRTTAGDTSQTGTGARIAAAAGTPVPTEATVSPVIAAILTDGSGTIMENPTRGMGPVSQRTGTTRGAATARLIGPDMASTIPATVMAPATAAGGRQATAQPTNRATDRPTGVDRLPMSPPIGGTITTTTGTGGTAQRISSGPGAAMTTLADVANWTRSSIIGVAGRAVTHARTTASAKTSPIV